MRPEWHRILSAWCASPMRPASSWMSVWRLSRRRSVTHSSWSASRCIKRWPERCIDLKLGATAGLSRPVPATGPMPHDCPHRMHHKTGGDVACLSALYCNHPCPQYSHQDWAHQPHRDGGLCPAPQAADSRLTVSYLHSLDVIIVLVYMGSISSASCG